jgi:NitT/TauT family transport system substrate-binding protein
MHYSPCHLRWLCALSALAILAGLSGCGGSSSASSTPKTKIAYIGLTCEAPLFVAFEKGFFKEEGLDPEMVKVDWSTMRDALSFGKVDATHTLVTYLLKPIQDGLDVRITGGVHKGCLRVQASLKSNIQKVEDFKGTRIGVQTMGSPPFLFASRAFADHGMDAEKDITWRVFPASELELALDKGEIDAVADSEPIGSLLLAHEKVRNVIDQAIDAPYRDEYCCAIAVSGKLLSSDPARAAKVTRAILKASKWVSTNPTAAAKISVNKGWIAANVDLDALALSKLKYVPSVSACADSIVATAAALKKESLLNPSTDPAELGKRAFAKLDGVTDDWIDHLTVEAVAGDGTFVTLDGKLITLMELPSCCVNKKN